jgi:hypothetical protein
VGAKRHHSILTPDFWLLNSEFQHRLSLKALSKGKPKLDPVSQDPLLAKCRSRNPLLKNGVNVINIKRLHENWTLALRCQVSGVSREKARASLKPDTRHLKPMLGEGFITPDNVQKKELFS